MSYFVYTKFLLSPFTSIGAKKIELQMQSYSKHSVELEGVEPSSKQGNHMLSTRLVIGKVFERKQDRDRRLAPYPLKCRHCIEAYNG